MNQTAQWREWMERIQDEVQEALDYQEKYWDFKNNIRDQHSVEEVRKNNIFYDMVAWGYAYKLFLTIRKQTAYSNRHDFNEITLLRLLNDMYKITTSNELEVDIDYLTNNKKLKLCRQYVNKDLAHASEEGPKSTTFQDGIDTISKIWELVQKYYQKLNQTPLLRNKPDYNWKEIFNYKWTE